MATATHTTKSITNDFQKYKDKENRRPEGLINRHYHSSNASSSGSVPRRYQSVFTEGTPLTSFGLRNDNHQRQSHSPPNHIQPQPHQRPLKPVKEFLTTQSIGDQQQLDDRRRSSSQTNGHSHSQTDATLQNVNATLAKTLNKLRQPTSNTASGSGRSTALHNGPVSARPITGRTTSHQNAYAAASSNFYYQLPGVVKGPLPAELITRRSTGALPSKGTGPRIVQQQPTGSVHYEIKSTDSVHTRVPTPFRVSVKSPDVDSPSNRGSNFHSITVDEYPERFQKSKYASNPQLATKATNSRQTFSPRSSSTDNPHRALPEVSVNPRIQSPVQQDEEQIYHPSQNGFTNGRTHSSNNENHFVSHINTNDKRTNSSKHSSHHHIKVEPTSTFKRAGTSFPQQISEVEPSTTIQRSTIGPIHIVVPSAKDSHNEGYVDREHARAQSSTPVNIHTQNDSTSTLKYHENHQERKRNSITPPPSPATRELNRIWKKHRNKYSNRVLTTNVSEHRTTKTRRPPGRLKLYKDETETETTATETQSKDEGMTRRHGPLPSDLGSDAWSDLTSEFSDTKFRKHPDIRTSTPNMTRQSSSQSSKEVGQIRKQLSDLQVMYSDLLKLLDIDLESVRSSYKSSTSSQADHHSRKHRFRKIAPVTSFRQSNIDMREVNQRFTRLETSIVTLAESIAKLSAQIQMQRVLKDDVHQLRQEVAELRQQIHHQRSLTPVASPGTTTPTSQRTTRLISPSIQRLAAANNNQPINVSTSYHPSTSNIQRSTSIIDPRQARKIEQFFGIEAMLRYFLSLLNYEEYAPVLEREKIGIYELPYVSEKKLQSLGIPYGPCARMIHEAQQYFISLLTLKSSGIDV